MGTPTLVVVGSGLAGLLVARLAAESRPVIVITKSTLFDSNTQWSQGGIAAVWSAQDSVELHTHDTRAAGDGLCDEEAMRVLSGQSRAAIEQLIQLGTQFDRDSENHFVLGLEGAHSIHRILHARGDATGAEIQRALVESVCQHPNIQVIEHGLVTQVVMRHEHVAGVRYYQLQERSTHTLDAPQVILATGGAGQLYRYTSNPQVATGDGVVLAYRAGADLMDLEFYQFHPTGLCLPNLPPFLITEALRGEGAVLRNRHGKAFMEDLHPQKDLAARDIVARAIAAEMSPQPHTHVYLDATHLPGDKLTKRFPTIFQRCLKYGIDIRKDWIPITPIAHYMIGGVATDLWGRTTVQGLYACGEVARTGVHGANRLASNSLLEAAVFAMRVVQALPRDLKRGHKEWLQAVATILQAQLVPSPPTSPSVKASEINLAHFQNLMWEKLGMIRHRQSLEYMCHVLQHTNLPDPIPTTQTQFELESMKLLGKLIAEAALAREESRGTHYRSDFPYARPELSSSTRQRRYALVGERVP